MGLIRITRKVVQEIQSAFIFRQKFIQKVKNHIWNGGRNMTGSQRHISDHPQTIRKNTKQLTFILLPRPSTEYLGKKVEEDIPLIHGYMHPMIFLDLILKQKKRKDICSQGSIVQRTKTATGDGITKCGRL